MTWPCVATTSCRIGSSGPRRRAQLLGDGPHGCRPLGVRRGGCRCRAGASLTHVRRLLCAECDLGRNSTRAGVAAPGSRAPVAGGGAGSSTARPGLGSGAGRPLSGVRPASAPGASFSVAPIAFAPVASVGSRRSRRGRRGRPTPRSPGPGVRAPAHGPWRSCPRSTSSRRRLRRRDAATQTPIPSRTATRNRTTPAVTSTGPIRHRAKRRARWLGRDPHRRATRTGSVSPPGSAGPRPRGRSAGRPRSSGRSRRPSSAPRPPRDVHAGGGIPTSS